MYREGVQYELYIWDILLGECVYREEYNVSPIYAVSLGVVCVWGGGTI